MPSMQSMSREYPVFSARLFPTRLAISIAKMSTRGPAAANLPLTAESSPPVKSPKSPARRASSRLKPESGLGRPLRAGQNLRFGGDEHVAHGGGIGGGAELGLALEKEGYDRFIKQSLASA